MVDMRKRFGKRKSEPPPGLWPTSPLKGEVGLPTAASLLEISDGGTQVKEPISPLKGEVCSSTFVPQSRTLGNDAVVGSVPPPAGGRSRAARVGVHPNDQLIAKPSGGVKPFTRQTQEFARGLRKTMTDAEYALWHYLRAAQLGVKFRRQQPVGTYIVDFVSMDARLVVEVDGGQHNDSPHDKLRDAFLKREGFRVLRFWNNDVLENIEGVCMCIAEAIADAGVVEPPPGLWPTSPLKGEVRSRASVPPSEILSSGTAVECPTSPFRVEVAHSAGGGQA